MLENVFISQMEIKEFISGNLSCWTEQENMLEEIIALLKTQPEGDLPLQAKIKFFYALKESKMYPLFIKWFDDQSLEDQLAFFLPKKQLDIGCFGLVESWWAETPNQKRRRLIFIGEGLGGSYQGIELHIPQLSIVERLRDLNNECIVSGTGGGEYHHKIIAII